MSNVFEYSAPNGDSENLGLFLVCKDCFPKGGNKPEFEFQNCVHTESAIAQREEIAGLSEGRRYALWATLGGEQRPALPHVGFCSIRTGEPILKNYVPVALDGGSNFMSPSWDEELGILSPGEGRLEVARMVLDFVKGRCHPNEKWTGPIKTKCPSPTHSFHHTKELKSHKFPLRAGKMMHLFAIVIDGMCIPCQMEAFTDDNFGMDGVLEGGQGSLRRRFALTLGSNGQLIPERRPDYYQGQELPF